MVTDKYNKSQKECGKCRLQKVTHEKEIARIPRISRHNNGGFYETDYKSKGSSSKSTTSKASTGKKKESTPAKKKSEKASK